MAFSTKSSGLENELLKRKLRQSANPPKTGKKVFQPPVKAPKRPSFF